ncbi:VCBS repeat-containing protein [Dyadobacter sp. LJ419]|uniref:VCBS repeat-containing protein n=2 Tax=Dyadobacter chenwenxiniae TaxID=2906456 RepID=A0A9X1THA4_9BACT|nr:VCBS repeat-containing protein [Dyadobacter chenwenxiniae]MCF0064540.1 VCBS repeat-containing protein [Dyadobacter chenwenxiniae]
MSKYISINYHFLLFLLLLLSCKKKQETLFRSHASSETGIVFSNTLTPNDSINPFTFTNFYNGGGVGIGDVNKDGKPDIFLGGNQVSCRLYLSKIDTRTKKWAFEDITEAAGVKTNRWCTGISMVDINQDGLLDIYVSVARHIKIPSADTENLLFVNQGTGEDNVPVFKEMAKAYGLNDASFTVQTAFFDVDLDGDLDAFMMNSAPDLQNPNFLRKTYNDGSYPSTGKLYRNEGAGENGIPVFTNISKEAGVRYEGLGLGLAISDLNKDGYPDIYCSNDFISSDIFYLNNGAKNTGMPGFNNIIREATAHTSLYGMGLDVADINNDTYPDIFQLDMLPEDNFRQKKMLAGQDYDRKEMSVSDQYGYQLQYMRNMLQLNQGAAANRDERGMPAFSEIGLLAGVAKTDWSWAPLIADFDNDGQKDIFITNGYRRDVTDRDFIQFKEDFSNFGTNNFKQQNALELIKKVPEVQIANYAYKNAGNLTFSNTSGEWGLDELSYSNGAAYADLDGDGDLDLVVNNIDSEAFIYENDIREKETSNFLSIALEGAKGNLSGIGSKVTIWAGRTSQYAELSIVRGFQSSVDPVLHFGLGKGKVIDSLEVVWPGGKSQKLYKVSANRRLVLSQKNAADSGKSGQAEPQSEPYFTDITKELHLDFQHVEGNFVDFKHTATMHKMLSKSGFAVASGDVNGDGLEDVFAGGSYRGSKPTIFLQTADGRFEKRIILQDSLHENAAAAFLDADRDGDPDLLIAIGGNELPVTEQAFYKVQLYLNNGKGSFLPAAETAIPQLSLSSSCLATNDFDKDGDLDIFIGGRSIPGKYPLPASSYLLRNDATNGQPHFTNVTSAFCPELLHVGMVCGAVWADTNQDGFDDLVLAGEWMPIRIFENIKGKSLHSQKTDNGLNQFTGWWNSVAASDFDHDGDIDFIAGNEGLNTFYRASEKEPIKITAKDFNGDGTFDPLMGYFIQGKRYPSVPRDALNQQVIQFRRKFPHYADYAQVTFDNLLSADEKEDAYAAEATFLQSAYIENLGQGKFKIHALPIEAQKSPVFGINMADVNADGHDDVVLTGNFYPNEVNMGRQDASTGLLLLGNGKGRFTPKDCAASGLMIKGDARKSIFIKGINQEKWLLTAVNSGSIQVNRLNRSKDK